MASKAKSSKKPSAAQLAARKRFAEMARARAAGKGKASKKAPKKGGNKSAKRSSKRDVRDDKGTKRVPSLATKPISAPKGSGETLDNYARVSRAPTPKTKRVQLGVGPAGPIFIDYWV